MKFWSSPGKKKAGNVDGLALAQRRALVVVLVVLEGKDGQRHAVR